MTTFGVMRDRITSELVRNDLSDHAKTSIISALAYYKRKTFNWNHTRATLALEPSQEYYQLPTDFIEVDTVVLRKGTELDHLDERTHHWLDREKNWDGYTGRPCVFSIQTRELRLFPTPDSSYTLLMSYVYELQNVSVSASDSASNAWMTEGEELIRTHAKIDLLENRIRGPESFQESQMLRMREREMFKQLDIEYKRAQSSGRLQPWS